MKKDVQEYCKACTKCFAANPKVSKDGPPLNSIPVPSKVWSLVGIDLIGPLQESSHGNKYVVAITDHFSKWTEAAGIPDKSAKSVAEFLYTVICRLGCMDSLISDQGREFVNKVVDNLLVHLQTEHRISSAYHPQTNGQRERDNRTLKTALTKLVNDECDNWDQLIPGVLFAYHTSVHASTKCTPFEVMYGRVAKLPVDVGSSPNLDAAETATPDLLESLNNIRNEIHSNVSNNISEAQMRQKKCYDQRNNSDDTLPIGTTVYIKNSRRIQRVGSKLEPRWTGPYLVEESLGKGRVGLINAKTQKKLKNTYHISNLKVYNLDSNSSDADSKGKGPDKPNSKSPSENKDTTNPESKAQKPNAENDVTHNLNQVGNNCVQEKRLFTPPSGVVRKNLAAALGVKVSKPVYFGKNGIPLTEPRRIYKTKGDGNCYFRCISHILTGSEEGHTTIRDQVVSHMTGEINKRLKNYLNHPVEEYLSQSLMNRCGVWATDAEIMATASLLGFDIVVYTKAGDSFDWLTYPASFKHDVKSDVAVYIENLCDHFNVVLAVK